MLQEMSRLKIKVLSVSALLAFSFVVNGGDNPSSRFYGGTVLMAEVKPVSTVDAPEVSNVSKYAVAPDLGSDVAFALVVVTLDSGRSLSSFDYVLSDGSSEYPCVAISDTDGVYDASSWEKKTTIPGKKYQMLFKVRLPSLGEPKYKLKFKLRSGAGRDPDLPFVNVGDKSFTLASKVPDGGMLGVDPYAPNPKVETKQSKDSASKKAESKPSGGKDAKKKKKKRGAKKPKEDPKKAAERAKWEEMLKRSLNKGD